MRDEHMKRPTNATKRRRFHKLCKSLARKVYCECGEAYRFHEKRWEHSFVSMMFYEMKRCEQ